jgi:hypothetical protein
MAATIISELDFSTIKEQLKTYLASQSQFADYDYDGSNMSVLLDVLAYNTFQNNFYTNMALGEMFLDSAQLRSSIVSHTKELNYLPRSYRSAQAKVTLSFSPGDSPATITVPKYTKFTTTVNGISYTFSTDETYLIAPTAGVYSQADIYLYEGRIQKEYYDVTASSKFILSNEKVDTNSIVVKVYASSAASADVDTYTVKPNLFGVASTDKVFYLQAAENEKYEVYFGQDSFGREPTTGEVVEITYRISSGASTNGATSFTPSGSIDGYTATVTLQTASNGGAVQETLSDIKYFAPKSIQIQDRAVTESDYVNLLKNNFSEIQTVSVYGGEKIDPPRYGKVIISIDITDSDGISENLKEKYKRFLTERSPLAIDPVIVSPEFLYVQPTIEIYYDTRITSKSAAEIEALARTAITNYSSTYLSDFDKNIRHSKLVRAIDDADTSIVGNDTTLLMVAEISPELNTNTNATIEFRNQLFVDHELHVHIDITKTEPGIKSSLFTYGGDTAFIQDNGLGVLQIITTRAGVGSFFVLNSNVGSVDYATGKVIIKNLNVSAYSGSAIKIFAGPISLDVLGPFDRIISIRDSDVVITVKGAND